MLLASAQRSCVMMTKLFVVELLVEDQNLLQLGAGLRALLALLSGVGLEEGGLERASPRVAVDTLLPHDECVRRAVACAGVVREQRVCTLVGVLAPVLDKSANTANTARMGVSI